MTIASAQMNGQGRVVVPVVIRRALELEGPTNLVFRLDDGVLTVETIRMVVDDVQRIAAEHVSDRESLVDELIAERRAESARE
ncbi:MAG: AbrB family transcriptional regulator [Actinomycetia bacterium]|nr:AbrB family transcriptional regulator [Actinomycetes bacterium]